MNGPNLTNDQAGALENWLFAIPAPVPSVVDPARAERGQAIFDRADVKCSTCHSGARLTNSATVDVGTGGAFQVPPLVGVATHAPFLHDGCAGTLRERFTTCRTPSHGDTSMLSAAELDDLIGYLESL
jgi:hypothetical protein